MRPAARTPNAATATSIEMMIGHFAFIAGSGGARRCALRTRR
jgi:hypothetical protein